MTIGLAFWILMLLWFVFDGMTRWPGGNPWPYAGTVGWLLLFLLFFLIGWHDFGAPIHG